MTMLVGYARVSTQDQKPQLQLDALKAAGCGRIFEEKASGAQRERPGLKDALEFLREGDTLVVWKLDRLARSLRQLLETVELLEGRGIGLRSLTESIDTTTSGGRLIFHIFGALAEFERSVIRERTSAGLAAARARGRVGGRPPAMTAGDIAVAKTLLANSEISVKEIARRQGVSVSTLYKHIPAARATVTRQEPA
jgi:DNA invertase Pin-like site-specific DNA recombinase